MVHLPVRDCQVYKNPKSKEQFKHEKFCFLAMLLFESSFVFIGYEKDDGFSEFDGTILEHKLQKTE